MRTRTLGLIVLLCGSLIYTAGCAKKEMVKTEEPLPQAAVTQPTPAPAPAPAAKTEVPAQQIAEAPVSAEPTQEPLKAQAAEETLERIHFDFDSYVLSQQARDILTRDAEALLKKMPTVKVSIEGHCDERGSDEYNLALGEKRAKAAQSYLVALGIPAGRLSTISYGKEKPLDPGHNEAAWAMNRRAEFVIVK